MAKDSYWFKHDSNAGRDLKLLELTHIHTHWGKGIYWDVIEVLREQNGYKFEKNKLQILCSMIMCGDFIKFKNWYNDCIRLELFIEDKKYFFSESLMVRMEKWETSKTNGSKGGRPKKTQLKPDAKPKRNQINNLNETIREEESIEEENIIDNKDHSIYKINSPVYLESLIPYFKGEFINIKYDDLKKEADSFVSQRIVAGDINKELHDYANHFINKIKKDYKDKKPIAKRKFLSMEDLKNIK